MPDFFDELISRDESIQSFFGQAQEQQVEAAQARKDFSNTAMRVTRDEITALKDFTRTQAASSAEASAALSEMEAAAAALHEQRTSILSEELEPLMRLVAPESSIAGLTSRLQTARTNLAVTQARADIKRQDYEIGSQARQKEIEIARLNAANEAGDVEDLQRLIQLTRGEQEQAVFIANQARRGTVKQMRQAIAIGAMTEEDMNAELASRTGRSLSLRAAQRADLHGRLEDMNPEQLAAYAEKNPKHAEVVRGIEQRRQLRDVNAEVTMRNATFQRFFNESPENIRKGVESGELTAAEAVRIADERERNRLALRNLRNQTVANDKELAKNLSSEFLRTAGAMNLQALAQDATENDGVTTIPGTNQKVTLEEINTHLKSNAEALSHQASVQASIKVSRAGLNSTAQSFAAMYGIPADGSTEATTIYSQLLQQPELPNGVRDNIMAITATIGEFNKRSTSPTAAALMTAKADEIMKASFAEAQAARAAGQSKTRQTAEKQFIEQNRMLTDQGLAAATVAEATALPTFTTGKPAFDAAMNLIRGAASQLSTPALIDKDADPAQLLTQQKNAERFAKNPGLAVSTAMNDPAVRSQVLKATVDEARLQLYRQVWAAQGDEQMLSMMDNNRSELFVQLDSGQRVFSEEAMVNFYADNNRGDTFTFDNLKRAVRELAPQYTRQLFQAEGNEAVVQAAINQVLFRNQGAAVVENSIASELNKMTYGFAQRQAGNVEFSEAAAARENRVTPLAPERTQAPPTSFRGNPQQDILLNIIQNGRQ